MCNKLNKDDLKVNKLYVTKSKRNYVIYLHNYNSLRGFKSLQCKIRLLRTK